MDVRGSRLLLPVSGMAAVILAAVLLHGHPAHSPHDGAPGPPLHFPPQAPDARSLPLRTVGEHAAGAIPLPLENPETRPDPVFEQLPQDEQESLRIAFHEARRAVSPVEGDLATLPQNQGVSHFAANPGQDLTARFMENGGVRFESGQPGKSWQGTLRLRTEGPAGAWQTSGVKAERSAGPLTEWYVNRTEGFEHGFTLAQRPGDLSSGEPLLLSMSLGELRADHDRNRPGDLVFIDPASGQAVIGYRDLKVWAADGRQLAAELRPTGEGFNIAVNDRDAPYPITVDPLIVSLEQQIDAGAQQAFLFGKPLAISGDTIAIGTPFTPLPGGGVVPGVVYIFRLESSRWLLKQVLRVQPGNGTQGYGIAVAIDGDLLAIGSTSLPWVEVYRLQNGVWTYLKNLQGTGTVLGDGFGSALSIDGNLVVVGAPQDDDMGADSGAAFVFTRTGSLWSESKVLPTNGAAGDRFGTSVCISGNVLAVGAPGKDFSTLSQDIGNAYVFTGDATIWTQQQILTAGSHADANALFGRNVFLDGDTLAVGSELDATSPGSGTVQVFARAGGAWTLQQRLVPEDGAGGPGYGQTIAVEGDTMAVGAWTDATQGTNAGSVYGYRRSGNVWSPLPKLLPAAGGGATQFGEQVALSGGVLVTGSSRDDMISEFGGSASVIDTSAATWTVEQKIFAGDGAINDHFALHLEIDLDAAVVGALDDDTPAGTAVGGAYIFRRRDGFWEREAKIIDSQGAANDRFGVSVGISGDTIIVGADFDDEDGINDRGSALVFVRGAGGTWARQGAKWLLESGASSNLGRAVAIDGNRAVIGAPNGNAGLGRAWVLTRTGTSWSWEGPLSPASSFDPPAFGFSVAISGNLVAVGEPKRDWYDNVENRVDGGAVWVFRRNGSGNWISEKVFLALSHESGAALGFSVALDGNTLVMGAPGCPPGWTGGVANATNRGAVFTAKYTGTNWPLSQQIPGPGTLQNNDYFGFAVAVQGDRALISAPGRGTNSGKAFAYRNLAGTWTYQAKMPAPAPAAEQFFGASVALSGDTALVGAFGAGTLAGSGAGAAYVFQLANPEDAVITLTRNGSNVTLDWPAGTGLALWSSPDLTAGTWVKVPGSEALNTHTRPLAGVPRMFFRLADP